MSVLLNIYLKMKEILNQISYISNKLLNEKKIIEDRKNKLEVDVSRKEKEKEDIKKRLNGKLSNKTKRKEEIKLNKLNNMNIEEELKKKFVLDKKNHESLLLIKKLEKEENILKNNLLIWFNLVVKDLEINHYNIYYSLLVMFKELENLKHLSKYQELFLKFNNLFPKFLGELWRKFLKTHEKRKKSDKKNIEENLESIDEKKIDINKQEFNPNYIKRGYHSIYIRRNVRNELRKFSTNEKYKIESPNFIELKRILTDPVVNNDTQIKIEKYLMNQGQLLFQEKLEKKESLNYNRLNSIVLRELNDSIDILENLLLNFRKQLKKIVLKKKNHELYLIKNILEYVDNNIIIECILGRLLRIISNYNLINNKNKHTSIAIDLGKEIIFNCMKTKFNSYIKNNENDFKDKVYKISDYIKENLPEEYKQDSFIVFLGSKLIGFLLDSNLVQMDVISLEIKQKELILIPGKQVIEKLKNLKLMELPNKLPMIVKPNKYGIDTLKGRERLGGYLLNDIDIVTPLIIPN
jgi:hypothetical protein